MKGLIKSQKERWCYADLKAQHKYNVLIQNEVKFPLLLRGLHSTLYSPPTPTSHAFPHTPSPHKKRMPQHRDGCKSH